MNSAATKNVYDKIRTLPILTYYIRNNTHKILQYADLLIRTMTQDNSITIPSTRAFILQYLNCNLFIFSKTQIIVIGTRIFLDLRV
jgi:hypothetical protein